MSHITCIYTAEFAPVLDELYHPGPTYRIWRVKFVPRLPADIRISLKKRDGPTYRIELVQQPVGRRNWGRRDGKYSTGVPDATASQIAERIGRWPVANT